MLGSSLRRWLLTVYLSSSDHTRRRSRHGLLQAQVDAAVAQGAVLAHQASDAALIAAKVLVHLLERHAALVHPIAYQGLDALGCEHGSVAATRGQAAHGALDIVLRDAQRLAEGLALDHRASRARTADHRHAATHLEPNFGEDRIGHGVVDDGEHPHRNLSALGAADHRLHVVAVGLAAVGEVRDDGEQLLGVALDAGVELGLVDVLGADERSILGLVVNVTTIAKLDDIDIHAHNTSPSLSGKATRGHLNLPFSVLLSAQNKILLRFWTI